MCCRILEGWRRRVGVLHGLMPDVVCTSFCFVSGIESRWAKNLHRFLRHSLLRPTEREASRRSNRAPEEERNGSTPGEHFEIPRHLSPSYSFVVA